MLSTERPRQRSRRISTAAVFSAAADASCTATTSTDSWAIIRLNGARLASQPATSALTLGGAGRRADEGDDGSAPRTGCSCRGRRPATPRRCRGTRCSARRGRRRRARLPTTPAAPPRRRQAPAGHSMGSTRSLVCSGLIGVGTNSVRVQSLETDGLPGGGGRGRHRRDAQRAVGARGGHARGDGRLRRALRARRAARPTGCAVAGAVAAPDCSASSQSSSACCSGGLASAARRRTDGNSPVRRSRGHGAARARGGGRRPGAAPARQAAAGWNVELRFGPYRPDVDSEFADRGQSARPLRGGVLERRAT